MVASRGRFAAPPHLRLLNRKLLDLAGRRIRKLAVFMPPRHAKSTTCSHCFPTWYLGGWPDHRVIVTAYNTSFAATWGRKVRDSINEWGPSIFGIRVRGDSSAANEWQLANHDGGMVAVGVGGGITGRGANVLIIDDPVKDAEEALSITVRQKHKDWYDSTADTRLEPDAVQLLIMTRWHADDLGAHVLKRWKESGEPYEIIKLPALAEPGDPLGRPVGAALWPERYSVEFFERKRLSTPFWYSALYRQEPTPEGGAIFRSEWFADRRYRLGYDTDGQPEYLRLLATGAIIRLVDCVIFAMVDPAIGKNRTKKRTSDDVAIGVFAITPATPQREQCLAVIHVAARVIPVDSIVVEMGAIAAAWPLQFAGFEANGFQVTIANEARRKLAPLFVREIEPGTTSKVARAVPAIELASSGRILLPESNAAPWVDDYLSELTQWTGQDGDRDNQVDVTAYAAKELVGRYQAGADDDVWAVGDGAWGGPV